MKHIASWVPPVASVLALVAAGVLLVQTASLRPIAQAQVGDGTAYEVPRTITVVGEGTVKIKPDIAQANIGVTVKDTSVKEASSQAKGLMEAVLAALRERGVADEDIQTSGFSIWTEEQPRGPEYPAQTQVAYRVGNQVMVTIRDLDKVGLQSLPLLGFG